MLKKQVLDKGYVQLIQADKEDKILEIIPICYKKDKLPEDRKKELLKKLYKEHAGNPTSSFEFVNFTFKVKCPIFVARQWFRHRMASYQEVSLRYTKAEQEVYIPENIANLPDVEELIAEIFRIYEFLLHLGVKKEQARFILPLGLYTEFFWQINLRSLINFLKVRLNKKSQKEIREYAKAILELIENFCPIIVSFIKEEIQGV